MKIFKSIIVILAIVMFAVSCGSSEQSSEYDYLMSNEQFLDLASPKSAEEVNETAEGLVKQYLDFVFDKDIVEMLKDDHANDQLVIFAKKHPRETITILRTVLFYRIRNATVNELQLTNIGIQSIVKNPGEKIAQEMILNSLPPYVMYKKLHTTGGLTEFTEYVFSKFK